MKSSLERVIRQANPVMLLGASVVVLAAFGLYAWIPDRSGWAPGVFIRPIGAVGVLGLGVSLMCHAREAPRRTRAGNVVALLAAASGLAALALGLLARDSVDLQAWIAEFAAPTLVGVGLIAIGVSLATSPQSRSSAYSAFGGLGAAWMLVLKGGYHVVPAFLPLAAPPTVASQAALLIAAVGALLRHQELAAIAALTARDEAGDALRRNLIAAAAIPSLFGLLAIAGLRAGLYDDRTETAMLAAASVTALAVAAFSGNSRLRVAQRERSTVAAALSASEDRFRRIVERASVGFGRLAMDGRWLQANKSLCEMLGYTLQELQSKTYSEVSRLEDLALDSQSWELLRRGEIDDYSIERRFLNKQGETVHAAVRLVRDIRTEGEEVRFVAMIQDMTARRAHEQALHVYERVIAATQSGIVITDGRQPDHPIISVNPAFERITGYLAADVLGKNPRFLNARARGQVAVGKLRRAIQAGESCEVMVRNHRANGDGFWNKMSIAPVHDAEGRVTHFVGGLVDANEQVQLQSEREALLTAAGARGDAAVAGSQAKERLLSVVSHELRSPLNAITSWASLLRDETDPDQRTRALDAIESSLHAQTRLLDDLLDASRLRTGALGIDFAELDLVAWLQAAFNRQLQAAHDKRISLSLRLPTQPAICYADGQRIEQVVQNLISNALKFTSAGGRVSVELEPQDGDWAILVSDTGRGLAPDSLPHVFDEFWQADTRGGRGLGIGLAIVKHLVERQGGSVSVESAGLGLGTTFRVLLPMRAATATSTATAKLTSPRSSADAAPLNDLSGAIVVVVDDEPLIAEAFASALAKEGAIPQVANSVSGALGLLASAPDALISDIGLPDRDGFDLIRSIRRSDDPNRGVLAIAVTAVSDREERKRIFRAGFDTYLAKPVEPQAVLRRLSEMRKRLAEKTPPRRRLLALRDERAHAAGLLAALRADGHEVIEVADASAVEVEASQRRPDAILLVEPVREPALAELLERLESDAPRPTVVGLVEPGTEPERCLSDLVVPLHDAGAIRRALRLLEGVTR